MTGEEEESDAIDGPTTYGDQSLFLLVKTKDMVDSCNCKNDFGLASNVSSYHCLASAGYVLIADPLIFSPLMASPFRRARPRLPNPRPARNKALIA